MDENGLVNWITKNNNFLKYLFILFSIFGLYPKNAQQIWQAMIIIPFIFIPWAGGKWGADFQIYEAGQFFLFTSTRCIAS
jgi:hypothetical protein